MKNSNDTIGNQTRDLPACSAVPQPPAPLRTHYSGGAQLKYWERPGIRFTEGWVGPRAGLDGCRISYPPGFNPGLSSL